MSPQILHAISPRPAPPARHASRVRVDPGISMICAWCHTPIARGRPCAGYECNYGMCRGCVAEQLARLEPRPARAEHPVSRRIPAPLALPAAPA